MSAKQYNEFIRDLFLWYKIFIEIIPAKFRDNQEEMKNIETKLEQCRAAWKIAHAKSEIHKISLFQNHGQHLVQEQARIYQEQTLLMVAFHSRNLHTLVNL